ncbi:MAG: hypothetical protein QG635_2281 [Bacteroidota bacterium]|nr:hypothetical protein [Bacteroidota bacterium]
MKQDSHFSFENEELSFYVTENIAVMKFKSNTIESLSHPDKTNHIISLLEWVEKDPVVRILMIINEPAAFDEESYNSFMKKIFVLDENGSLTRQVTSEKKVIRARQMNAFRTFISKMADYRKIYISCVQGTVVTPFFGASLTADFRFASDNMHFSLAHAKYGLHPSGALPFLLPRFVGQAKASELLFRCGNIPADEAKNIGIINEVFPSVEFERYCFDKAKNFCNLDPIAVRLTKRLIGTYKEELEHYFDFESKMIGF